MPVKAIDLSKPGGASNVVVKQIDLSEEKLEQEVRRTELEMRMSPSPAIDLRTLARDFKVAQNSKHFQSVNDFPSYDLA